MVGQRAAPRIPYAVFEEHHHVLPAWSSMREATLLHIDAHDDLADETPLPGDIDRGYVCQIMCAQFIIPAVHTGIIAEMYWHNPHSKLTRYYGRDELMTRTAWNERGGTELRWMRDPVGRNVRNITSSSPLILDVDLDAFCCDEYVEDMPDGYDGVVGWRGRIRAVERRISSLVPALITVARSQGGVRNTYVPSDLVDEVQDAFASVIDRLYR